MKIELVLGILATFVGLGGCAGEGSEGSEPATGTDDIIAGTQVSQEEYDAKYPWMLAFANNGNVPMHDEFFNQSNVACGAELVAADWVLTAAHCVTEEGGQSIDPRPIRFARGSVRTTEMSNRFRASEVHVHPRYDAASQNFDVALVRLREPQPPPFAKLAAVTEESLSATVIGWGNVRKQFANRPGGFKQPKQIRKAELDIMAQAECREMYSSRLSITPNMVCATGVGRGTNSKTSDSCQGDSGGPLIVEGAGGPAVVGVVSFGIGCGVDRFPGVYARVDGKNGEWIQRCMAGDCS